MIKYSSPVSPPKGLDTNLKVSCRIPNYIICGFLKKVNKFFENLLRSESHIKNKSINKTLKTQNYKKIYSIPDNIAFNKNGEPAKKHFCIKTITGKNKKIGINIITSEKGTEKEKRQIENKLRKRIDPKKTNLNKPSLIMDNVIIRNIKTNKLLNTSDIKVTNKKIEESEHKNLKHFIFYESAKSYENRKKGSSIDKKKATKK